MYMIEITENKLSEMSELAEKMLRYGGKLMQCLDDICEDGNGRMGRREPMPDYRDEWRERDEDDRRYRDRYGERGGYGRSRRY